MNRQGSPGIWVPSTCKKISEIKNLLDEICNQLDTIGEKISAFKERKTGTNQTRKTEKSVEYKKWVDLGSCITTGNLGEERICCRKKYLKIKRDEKYQLTNSRISVKPEQNKHKETHTRHIIVLLVTWLKTKDEKKILKATRERRHITYRAQWWHGTEFSVRNDESHNTEDQHL